MPELPEVETIKLGLERKIIGLKIKSVKVLEPKKFYGDSKMLRDKIVLKVWRRAKVLGIDLGLLLKGPVGLYPRPMSSLDAAGTRRGAPAPATPDLTLLFHLKMSGQLILIKNSKLKIKNSSMPIKSTRVIFEFSDPDSIGADGSKLYFNDQRKFGWIRVVNTAELIGLNYGMQKAFGPEPLEPGFTHQKLSDNLKNKLRSNIKQALLDQAVVAGLGNIYVSEALFLAKIDPRRKVSSLSDSDYTRLFRSIKEALSNGILHGGSSRAHFVNEEGKKGYFLDFAYVYGREGQKCRVCGTKIAKIRLGGRGTTFCPKCQK